MQQLMLKPTIYKYDTCKKFADEFHIEKGDLVITNEYIYEPFFGKMDLECDVIFQEKYGAGEPSDDMAEAIYKDIKGEHKRIIAIGGGTVIDISKLFALKQCSQQFQGRQRFQQKRGEARFFGILYRRYTHDSKG